MIATDIGTCRIAIEIVSSIVQQKLPPAELTTEAFTCRNGDNQIVLVTIKKLSEEPKCDKGNFTFPPHAVNTVEL